MRNPTQALLANPLALGFAFVLTACASAAEGPPGELRVIVRYSTSMSGNDPEIVRRLERATRTTVRLSTMVSDTEAAYWLQCSKRDPECNDAMGRLMTDPQVVFVVPDRFRYPSDPPQ